MTSPDDEAFARVEKRAVEMLMQDCDVTPSVAAQIYRATDPGVRNHYLLLAERELREIGAGGVEVTEPVRQTTEEDLKLSAALRRYYQAEWDCDVTVEFQPDGWISVTGAAPDQKAGMIRGMAEGYLTMEPRRPTHGFDTLKLPFAPDQWCDADERMFHACFLILGQFVEQELGTEVWEGREDDPEARHRGFRLHSCGDSEPAAIDLWLWYRDELPKLEAEYAADAKECFGGAVPFTDPVRGTFGFRHPSGSAPKPKFPYQYIENLQDEKLKQLIALRRALWT